MQSRPKVGGVLLVACLLVATAIAAETADPNGTWKWSVAPAGQNIEVTTELKLVETTLTGKVVVGDRSFDISDGTFTENQVAFTVVAQSDGNKMTARFSGKVEADSITGKIAVEVNGETTNLDWNATRQK